MSERKGPKGEKSWKKMETQKEALVMSRMSKIYVESLNCEGKKQLT